MSKDAASQNIILICKFSKKNEKIWKVKVEEPSAAFALN